MTKNCTTAQTKQTYQTKKTKKAETIISIAVFGGWAWLVRAIIFALCKLRANYTSSESFFRIDPNTQQSQPLSNGRTSRLACALY